MLYSGWWGIRVTMRRIERNIGFGTRYAKLGRRRADRCPARIQNARKKNQGSECVGETVSCGDHQGEFTTHIRVRH